MNYKCYICFETFEFSNETIQHLRKNHCIIENRNARIQCIVNKPNVCEKKFQTFSGLRRHLESCLSKQNQNVATCEIENSEKNANENISVKESCQNDPVDVLSHCIEHEFNLNTIAKEREECHADEPIIHVVQKRDQTETEIATATA